MNPCNPPPLCTHFSPLQALQAFWTVALSLPHQHCRTSPTFSLAGWAGAMLAPHLATCTSLWQPVHFNWKPIFHSHCAIDVPTRGRGSQARSAGALLINLKCRCQRLFNRNCCSRVAAQLRAASPSTSISTSLVRNIDHWKGGSAGGKGVRAAVCITGRCRRAWLAHRLTSAASSGPLPQLPHLPGCPAPTTERTPGSRKIPRTNPPPPKTHPHHTARRASCRPPWA